MVKAIENHQLNELITSISTKDDAKRQLHSLGLQKGMLVLVDAKIDNLGYIASGAQVLIEALMDVVGYEGTIVMPTFTLDFVDPACRYDMKIDRESWKYIREDALPFSKKLTAPQHCDEIVSQFLRNDGIARSYHPLYSFAAWGKYAKLICDRQPLHFGLSMDSPLGKLFELNAFVLLLGCDYQDSTIFHLARYSGKQLPIRVTCSPVQQGGHVKWKDMLDLEFDNSGYNAIGEVMEERKTVKTSYLGAGRCRFFNAREAVNIATAYFNI